MKTALIGVAAEGIPAISRRKALTSIAALTAGAAVAIIPTEAASATEPEHPCARARRLAWELSDAMEGWCTEFGGLWAARVLPASATTPVAFDNLDAPAKASPIMVLFREWDALYQGGFHHDGPDEASEAALGVYCDELRALENRIMALPAVSAADFAAKVIAKSNYGDYAIDRFEGDDIFADAQALIGRARS